MKTFLLDQHSSFQLSSRLQQLLFNYCIHQGMLRLGGERFVVSLCVHSIELINFYRFVFTVTKD